MVPGQQQNHILHAALDDCSIALQQDLLLLLLLLCLGARARARVCAHGGHIYLSFCLCCVLNRQIYVNPDRRIVLDQLKACEAAGMSALCVTVDSAVAGKRERDLRNKIRRELNVRACLRAFDFCVSTTRRGTP